jgi:hypothetical protein
MSSNTKQEAGLFDDLSDHWIVSFFVRVLFVSFLVTMLILLSAFGFMRD